MARKSRKNRSKKNKTKKSWEKMNCHPNTKNKTISNKSCYDRDILMKIKNAYNKNHINKIYSHEPKDVWKKLRKNIKHCNKEDCWLNELNDEKEIQKVDDLLFSPDRPNSWDENPNEWLSNYDIAHVLKQYEISHPSFRLLGPSAIDYDNKPYGNDKCVWQDLCRLSLQDLLNRNKTKLGIVFNLDKHNEPGSHWVSMFVDLEDKIIFYYDSALNPVPKQISKLKREIIKQGKNLDKPIKFTYIQNEYSHQKTNTECGMYTLFFIITMLTKEMKSNKVYGGRKKLSKKKIIDLFLRPGINDKLMMDYREEYFNHK